VKYEVAPPHVQAFARQVKDEYLKAKAAKADAAAQFEHVRQGVYRLRGMGMGAPAIAEALGMSERMIRLWTNK